MAHRKGCSCACGHIFYQHFDSADQQEHDEAAEPFPNEGCGMQPCECRRFDCVNLHQ